MVTVNNIAFIHFSELGPKWANETIAAFQLTDIEYKGTS